MASGQCCSEQNVDEGKEKNLELVLYVEGSESKSPRSEVSDKTAHTDTCWVVVGMLVCGSA
jgi:hypothetical protein